MTAHRSSITRRDWLQASAGLALASGHWTLWAAPTPARPRLLVVFLRGAYDSLSALVPYAEPLYHELRPTLALARPTADASAGSAAVALDTRWGMHPLLEDAVAPLWGAGQLAFVPFAGTEFVSRSHFQAQDWVEFGQPASGHPDGTTGFLNRLLVELKGPPQRPAAIALTQTLPPVLRGPRPVVNSPLTLRRTGRSDASYEQLLMQMYGEHAYAPLVRDGLGLRREIAAELREEMQAASRDAVPVSGFALEAARLGRLLRDHPEYSTGFVDIGGWDTHAAQGGAHGALANRLHALGSGLAALSDALGAPEWQRTVVVVLSEFGRTFRENGSGGTDHGHGTAMWILGGAVRGGAIRGEQTGLRAADLHQDRDLPVLNEYRASLGGLFGRMFGLSPEALGRVFPGARPNDLGLL